jgi:hypothetical protein
MKKFALSSHSFSKKADAEAKVNKWWKGGQLKDNKTKLYKVVEVYDLELKFIKRK